MFREILNFALLFEVRNQSFELVRFHFHWNLNWNWSVLLIICLVRQVKILLTLRLLDERVADAELGFVVCVVRRDRQLLETTRT